MTLQQALDRSMPDIARRFLNELIMTVPVDRGGLKISLKVNVVGRKLIITMNETGKWSEFGTPPHVIKAKPGKVLHWHKTKGRTQHSHPHSKSMAEDAVFAKEVKHPGTRPTPFIRTAIATKLRSIIIEEINNNL